jgi:xanthine dehydrogenase accessory factor
MRDVMDTVEAWRERGDEVAVALATVVETWGSAPRREGAKLALNAGGGIAGSVSGGCVEGAVVEAGQGVLARSRPERVSFGVSDESAWSVGLSCGGHIDVWIEPLHPGSWEAAREAVRGERAVAVATVLGGAPDVADLVGGKRWLVEGRAAEGSVAADLDAALDEALTQALGTGRARKVDLDSPRGSLEVFVDVVTPSPLLVAVGGVHIAVALTRIARALGFRTAIVEPRTAFGSAERFPDVDLLLHDWPDAALERLRLGSSSAVAVLTHDPKLDDPALLAALRSQAFYVGALGSRKTQARRRERLLAAGLDEASLARLHAPIGLDLGGRAPEEIALAVMAQVVAVRNRAPSPPRPG